LVANYQELSQVTAEAIAEQLKRKPNSCFGLPTGHTPLGCYSLLSDWSAAGKLDWSQSYCFALDDYVDVSPEYSFDHYLQTNLYGNTNLPASHSFNPSRADNYDQLIEEHGGLDLAIIGIGNNGHIAFNEPGTPPNSWTHCLWLAESTRKANASFFASPNQVPKMAITMGIATLLSSRKLLLIASGQHKADIIHKAFSGPITQEIPASYLQGHSNLTIITDLK
jgi:glucosamine-6-phosphate deaminase